MPKNNHAKDAAQELINHSAWIAIAFVAITLIAGGLEWTGKLLVRVKFMPADGFLAWTVTLGAGVIALSDIALVGGAAYILGRHFLQELKEKFRKKQP